MDGLIGVILAVGIIVAAIMAIHCVILYSVGSMIEKTANQINDTGYKLTNIKYELEDIRAEIGDLKYREGGR